MAAHGIKRLAVLGAGQMGSGIAYVSALHARTPVLLHDANAPALTSALTYIRSILNNSVSKGRLRAEEAEEALSLIRPVDSVREFEGVDMVIEAVREDLATKASVMREVASVVGQGAILATNTSSIGITKIARAVVPEGVSPTSEEAEKAAGRVVGLHFFNPVPVMKLVELISAMQTTQDTLDRARAFAVACGKEVTTSQDVPGFVSNALLMPFLNEAIMCLEKGIANRDDIDKTFRLGMNHPMGPLELADFIGLDTCLAIQQTLHSGTGEDKYRPALLLGRMVDAGWVGRKGGRGFYEWKNGKKVVD